MSIIFVKNSLAKFVLLVCIIALLQACTTKAVIETGQQVDTGAIAPAYIIGPGDMLRIFVWGNTELSGDVPVRPDGRITTPLVEDIVASGKTPTQLAREMEQNLKRYMKNPVVTVTVTQFVGRYTEQIRVVGEVATPRSIPFRESISVLDVIITVGGLTEFAAGNRAIIVRTINGKSINIPVKLENLLDDGDFSANVRMQPGDVLFVPEAWF
ncbi:MAG: polysaccharide export protein [Gammaproteobacteria bacterium]|nr:polysaccharide export protein [Gammaproteobacteria bacterium]